MGMLSTLGSPWMMLLMNGFEALSSHMGINLSSGDIRMTQQKLNHP